MEKEKKFKGSKFSTFIKKNIYLILMIVCLLAIIGMIAYTFAVQGAEDSTQTNANINDNQNVNIEKPDDNKPNENNPNEGNEDVETLTEIGQPVANVEVMKDYTDTELVFNATMKHWATHQAVDYKCEKGEKVYAVFDGVVTSISATTLRGTTVTIKHSNGFESVYSLLDSKVSVKIGDKIKKGDIIGVVGDTGVFESADGTHFHFEFKKDGEFVDPNYYFEGANK